MFTYLFKPVSEKKLVQLVHVTYGAVIFTVLLLSGAFGEWGENVVFREVALTATGVLIGLSLFKTLFHKVLPVPYIRQGVYIMSCSYILYILSKMLEGMGVVAV